MAQENNTNSVGFPIGIYNRRFRIDGAKRGLVRIRAGLAGLHSVLFIDKREVASDWTPITGKDATRNHRLVAKLEDGRTISVEAGYVNWWSVGIAVDLDGERIHESHPGKKIAYPAKLKAQIEAQSADGTPTLDYGKLQKNRVPIIVDIATGLLFFAVAKMTDLTTAAFVGAGVGVALLVIQRFVKVDLLGGLALFGIVMLLISAGFAWFFKDEEFVKQRSTIVGLIAASFFLIDGLFRGRYLGERLSRYLVFTDVIPWRLSTGLGLSAIVMAGINWAVAKYLPTDVWLFYTTFGDVVVAMAVFFFILGWARGGKSAFSP
jgi:intracellular septation protein A